MPTSILKSIKFSRKPNSLSFRLVPKVTILKNPRSATVITVCSAKYKHSIRNSSALNTHSTACLSDCRGYQRLLSQHGLLSVQFYARFAVLNALVVGAEIKFMLQLKCWFCVTRSTNFRLFSTFQAFSGRKGGSNSQIFFKSFWLEEVPIPKKNHCQCSRQGSETVE